MAAPLLPDAGFSIQPPLVHCGRGQTVRLDNLIGVSATDGLLTLHAAPRANVDGGCCSSNMQRRLHSVHVRFDGTEEAERAVSDVSRAACLPRRGSRRLLVLINPRSGEQRGVAAWEEVSDFFRASGAVLDVVTTSAAGEAQQRAFDADLTSTDAIICVSGDGLIHEVVNGLMGRPDAAAALASLSLGVIPAGTGNSLSCSILKAAGESLHATSSAFLVCRGAVSKLDLWRVEQEGEGGKSGHAFLSLEWALVSANHSPSLHLPHRRVRSTLATAPPAHSAHPACPHQASDIDIGSEAWRCLGPLRFDLYALWRLITGWRYTGGFRFRRPGAREWHELGGPFLMVWACNMPWLSPDVQMAPLARLDDGCADIVIVQRASRAALLDAFVNGKVEQGTHIHEDWCQYEKAEAFELTPEPRTARHPGFIAVDGELWPFAKTRCEVSPVKLTLLGVGG
jgi:sphingosine kinase